MAHIVQLIYTERSVGAGVKGDPCRALLQLWTLDGKLVAQHDPYTGSEEGDKPPCPLFLNLTLDAVKFPPQCQ